MGIPQATDMVQTSGGQPSLAKDLFEDMGRKAEEVSNNNDEQKVVDEIESLCMNCHEDGITRLLLTRIPFFREIVIMSFSCEKCGFQNNEIQSAGQIQPKGAKYALRVEKEDDLQRNVVKSDVCAFRIEDVDLEIPPGKGQYSNVEGIIRAVKDDLESHQDARMQQMPEVGAKVAEIIRTMEDMLNGHKYPFMISVDDPTGNSTIEPRPGDAAGKWAKSEYIRTAAQNAALGLGDDVPAPGTEAPETSLRPEYHSQGLVGGDDPTAAVQANNVDQEEDIVENQVYSFPASCPGCTRPCATNMKMVNIPFFKQVVLMSTVCESCGYRSNEVKTGGEVPEKGRKITLKVSTKEDLARDILKSESAALSCPELQLRVEPGTMGGRFTTVEGIMTNIRKDLRGQAFGLEDGDADLPDGSGDSMASDSKKQWEDFFTLLGDAIEGRKEFTLILEDPLAGSYVQSLTAPEPDPKLELEDYTRTHDEEEDLGLNDIKTEGYEEDNVETTS
ncbi:zf-ZPR1-domain-containing protein [Sphaerulina musiva SO2202]|uniref:Zf-ZPR1-domain-containing protein n=1 Tax=Sphaerulina musiva (strain SO2202) TaxID=692275 RepID=N1QDR8_SPHMS|nr:zf-ZPR1-domain-containing protein [Sphaerulina musiva SO2202]EMF09685.1 zf-ZPR1-domain-containing protein [Sphaerulina musiva SO2202]